MTLANKTGENMYQLVNRIMREKLLAEGLLPEKCKHERNYYARGRKTRICLDCGKELEMDVYTTH